MLSEMGTSGAINSEFRSTGFPGFGAGYPCSPSSSTDLFIWTGAVNTDWFNTGNWASGALPGPTSEVQVSGSLVNYPVASSNATIKSLLLPPGATCQVNTGANMTLTGS